MWSSEAHPVRRTSPIDVAIRASTAAWRPRRAGSYVQARPDHTEAQVLQGRGLQRLVVAERAVAPGRAPHAPRDRLHDGAGDHDPVHLGPDRDREPGQAVGVVHGAVDGVDDPADLARGRRAAGAALLAQHEVVGAGGGQALAHQRLAVPVALGDDVGGRALRVQPAGVGDGPLAHREGQGGGLAGDRHGEVLEHLLVHRGVHRDHPTTRRWPPGDGRTTGRATRADARNRSRDRPRRGLVRRRTCEVRRTRPTLVTMDAEPRRYTRGTGTLACPSP